MDLSAREGVEIWHIYVFLAGLRQIFMHYRIKVRAVFIYCYISFEVFFKLLETWADIGYNPKHDMEGGPEPEPGSGQTEMTYHGLDKSICDFLCGLGSV